MQTDWSLLIKSRRQVPLLQACGTWRRPRSRAANSGSCIEIVNESGELVETISFEDAVQIREGPRLRRH